MSIIQRRTTWALALALLVGCGDEPVSETGAGGGPGSGGAGGIADGGAPAAGGGGDGGAGADGGAGGAGGELPVTGTAPTELNNASAHMSGSTLQLTFQLGRTLHQRPASGPNFDLTGAPPTHAP